MSDPGYQAQFERGYEGPPIVPPARPEVVEAAAPEDASAPTTEPGAAAERDPLPESEPPQRRSNPWSIALLVVSLAMIAAGWGVLRAYATTNANGYSAVEQTAAFLQANMGPALLTVGIAGVIVWLVLGAVRAAERRGPA